MSTLKNFTREKFTFSYPEESKIEEGFQNQENSDSIETIQIFPPNCVVSVDVFGMILIETNEKLKGLSTHDYVKLSVQNLENLNTVQSDASFVDIKTQEMKFADQDAVKISYSVVDRNVSDSFSIYSIVFILESR